MTRFLAIAALAAALCVCSGRKGDTGPEPPAPSWAETATVFALLGSDSAIVAFGDGPRDGNGRYRNTRLLRVGLGDGQPEGEPIPVAGHAEQLATTSAGRVFVLIAATGALQVIDPGGGQARACPAPRALRRIAAAGDTVYGLARSLYRVDACPGESAAPVVAGDVTHLSRLASGELVAGLPGPWMLRLRSGGKTGPRTGAAGETLRISPQGCLEAYPLDTQRVSKRVCPDALPVDASWAPGGGVMTLSRGGLSSVDGLRGAPR